MAPEDVVLAVSVSCSVLLIVGSLVAGSAFADLAARKKRDELEATIGSLRKSLRVASIEVDEARAAVGQDLVGATDRNEELLRLKEKLGETEADLKNAKSDAEEARTELTIVREKLDQTEERLAILEKSTAELSDADLAAVREAAARAPALEEELAKAKRDALKTEAAKSERDHALRRVDESEKVGSDEARVRSLQEQLNTAEANQAKLKEELRTREERIEALSSSSGSEALDAMRREVAAADDRVAVSERVMEGVRARSKVLSAELKKVKAELAALKAKARGPERAD